LLGRRELSVEDSRSELLGDNLAPAAAAAAVTAAVVAVVVAASGGVGDVPP